MPTTLQLTATPPCVKCNGRTTAERQSLTLVTAINQQVTMEQVPAFRCATCDDAFVPKGTMAEITALLADPRYEGFRSFRYPDQTPSLYVVSTEGTAPKLVAARSDHQAKLLAFGTLEGVKADQVTEVLGADPDYPTEEVPYAVTVTPRLP